MAKVAHRTVRFVSVLIVLLVLFIVAAPVSPGDWVKAHAASLPTTLAELEGVPVLSQRAAFAATTAEAKSRIMQERVAQIISANVNVLTSAQQATLWAIRERLTPAAYTKGTAEHLAFKGECEELKEFPQAVKDALKLAASPSKVRSLTALYYARAIDKFAVVVHADSLRRKLQCNCAAGSYCATCDPWACYSPPGGGWCGCFLMYDCTSCQLPENGGCDWIE